MTTNGLHQTVTATPEMVTLWIQLGMKKALPEFLEQTKPEKVIERNNGYSTGAKTNQYVPETERTSGSGHY